MVECGFGDFIEVVVIKRSWLFGSLIVVGIFARIQPDIVATGVYADGKSFVFCSVVHVDIRVIIVIGVVKFPAHQIAILFHQRGYHGSVGLQHFHNRKLGHRCQILIIVRRVVVVVLVAKYVIVPIVSVVVVEQVPIVIIVAR